VSDIVARLHLELLGQLVLAVVLGGAIGLERELHGKPAGLRTTILICIGATLFTDFSIHIGAGRGDPGRIAAQILTGVGFIGAGTILHTRGQVTGLTSAATIWVVAAIGMALGAGAYVEAVGSTVLVLVVLTGLFPAEALLGRRMARSRLVINLEPAKATPEDALAVVRGIGLTVEGQSCWREGADIVLELDLRGPRDLHQEVTLALLRRPGVRAVSTGE
jgi:putative Mg2+ transporter-C (MgtC) family protein